MPGLQLRTFGGVSARAQPTTAPEPAPTSVTAAAFGPGYTTSPPSTGSALTPDDAFGTCFWLGVVAVAVLVFIRHSLPR